MKEGEIMEYKDYVIAKQTKIVVTTENAVRAITETYNRNVSDYDIEQVVELFHNNLLQANGKINNGEWQEALATFLEMSNP